MGLAAGWERIVSRAGRRYCPGPTVLDALATGAGRVPLTVGYWSGPGDAPARIAAIGLGAIAALRDTPGPRSLSVKAADLGFDHGLVDEIASEAARSGVELHFDALGPECADRTLAAAEVAAARCPIGTTLPACWRRSLDDVARVADLGPVRVVKGAFPERGGPPDVRAAWLALAERVAARAQVRLATHDHALLADAIARVDRGSATVEQLVGLPMRATVPLARAADVPIRLYVPFGRPYPPYRSVAKLLRLARDMIVTSADLSPLLAP